MQFLEDEIFEEIGDMRRFNDDVPMNTSFERIKENVIYCLGLIEKGQVKPLVKENKSGSIIMVGGGESAKENIHIIRMLSKTMPVACANGAHDWLIKQGIVPTYHFILDSQDKQSEYVKNPHKDVIYMMATRVSPLVFDNLNGHDVRVWSSVSCNEEIEALKASGNKFFGVHGGGVSTGVKGISLLGLLGYDSFHIFGLDCSFSCEKKHHIYDWKDGGIPHNTKVARLDGSDREFLTTTQLMASYRSFMKIIEKDEMRDKQVAVYGDNLLSHGLKLTYGEIKNG